MGYKIQKEGTMNFQFFFFFVNISTNLHCFFFFVFLCGDEQVMDDSWFTEGKASRAKHRHLDFWTHSQKATPRHTKHKVSNTIIDAR